MLKNKICTFFNLKFIVNAENHNGPCAKQTLLVFVRDFVLQKGLRNKKKHKHIQKLKNNNRKTHGNC